MSHLATPPLCFFSCSISCADQGNPLFLTSLPTCSCLFSLTLLQFALLRATSHDNTQGLCQYGPESKLSPGENPPPDWQEQAPEYPLNMRVSWVKASLDTWPGGHSAKHKPVQLFPDSPDIKHGKDTGVWKCLTVCSFLLTVQPVLILWSPEYTQ